MEGKESGIKQLFEDTMKKFGVPDDNMVNKIKVTKKSKSCVSKFITGKANLLVIGKDNYSYCVRLMRLRYVTDMGIIMKWIPQSAISYDMINKDKADVKALVNLYEEETVTRKQMVGNLVNRTLMQGSQMLIGVHNVDDLESTFPYDLDSIENNFEVWKLG